MDGAGPDHFTIKDIPIRSKATLFRFLKPYLDCREKVFKALKIQRQKQNNLLQLDYESQACKMSLRFDIFVPRYGVLLS
jgi:hypothetical protein